MSNHCSKNAVKLYRSHLHLAQIVLYSDRYYRNLSWRCPAVIGQMLMPVENEKIKPAAFTLCHQRMCCRFPLYTSPLLHPASSSSSSKVPTQNTDSILGQKPCVAKKKKLKCQGIPLITAFSSWTRPCLFLICTPTVPTCFICFSIFIFAMFIFFLPTFVILPEQWN